MEKNIKKIQLSRNEIKELIQQYKILYELIESVPRRKIMVDEEKLWYRKRNSFLKQHKKIDKLFY